MWCGHMSSARGCQCMDSIVEIDLHRSIAREEDGHRCDVKVMKNDPVSERLSQVRLYETV